MTFLGIFPHEVKNIIFVWRGAHEMRLNPHEVRLNIKMNIPARRWGTRMGWGGVPIWYPISPSATPSSISGTPSPLSGAPSPPVWYTIPYLVSCLPYLVHHLCQVHHPPIWHPIPPSATPSQIGGTPTLTRHQSGILHSLIFPLVRI